MGRNVMIVPKLRACSSVLVGALAGGVLFAVPAKADCNALPSHATLQTAVTDAIGGNGGLGFEMWATIVDRDGNVCAVAFSGGDRDDQWPGSRVISAQKANTANAFSLAGLALSTANLYSAVQPGGTLFGLQESNPVNPAVAYAGNAASYGQPNDPMAGKRIGGVNVFGGGLALYTAGGAIVGGLGVSGDTSCTDHIVAWRIRDDLDLDSVPGGVSPTGDDNIIHDITVDNKGHAASAGGFGHPTCLNLPGQGDAAAIAAGLPTNFPIE